MKKLSVIAAIAAGLLAPSVMRAQQQMPQGARKRATAHAPHVHYSCSHRLPIDGSSASPLPTGGAEIAGKVLSAALAMIHLLAVGREIAWVALPLAEVLYFLLKTHVNQAF